MPDRDSPGLIAAFYVLHRLPAPRHPPCALSSLTIKDGYTWDYNFICSCYPFSIFKDPISANITRGALNLFASPKALQHLANRQPAPRSLVEVSGIEPLTSCLQSRRS